MLKEINKVKQTKPNTVNKHKHTHKQTHKHTNTNKQTNNYRQTLRQTETIPFIQTDTQQRNKQRHKHNTYK